MDLCFGVLHIIRSCCNSSRRFQEFFRRVCSDHHVRNGPGSSRHSKKFKNCQWHAIINTSMQLGERLFTQKLERKSGPHP